MNATVEVREDDVTRITLPRLPHAPLVGEYEQGVELKADENGMDRGHLRDTP